MSVQGELLEMLEKVAHALGEELRARLVFVGGCSTAVLITDEITLQEVRATDDVDLIADIKGFVEWGKLQEKLHARGFKVSGEDDVICRMRLGELKVDFMPDDERILGFTNQWYKQGIETAIKYTLPSGNVIKHLTPPLFVATKLEAYLDRGEGDPLGSHDLEDILLLVDGREELIDEVKLADEEIRQFVKEQLSALMGHADFDHFLYGNIRGPEGRADIVRKRFEALIV